MRADDRLLLLKQGKAVHVKRDSVQIEVKITLKN